MRRLSCGLDIVYLDKFGIGLKSHIAIVAVMKQQL